MSDYSRGLLPWFFRPPVPITAIGIGLFTTENKNILVISGGSSVSAAHPVPSTSTSPPGLYFFELLPNNTVRPLAHMNVYWKVNVSIADYWEFQPLTASNLWGTQVSVRWPFIAIEWRGNSPDQRVTVYNARDKADATSSEGIPATICAAAGNAHASGVWFRNRDEIWVLDFSDLRTFIYQNSVFYPLVAKQ